MMLTTYLKGIAYNSLSTIKRFSFEQFQDESTVMPYTSATTVRIYLIQPLTELVCSYSEEWVQVKSSTVMQSYIMIFKCCTIDSQELFAKAISSNNISKAIYAMELGAIPEISKVELNSLIELKCYRLIGFIFAQIHHCDPQAGLSNDLVQSICTLAQSSFNMVLQLMEVHSLKLCFHQKNKLISSQNYNVLTAKILTTITITPLCQCRKNPSTYRTPATLQDFYERNSGMRVRFDASLKWSMQKMN